MVNKPDPGGMFAPFRALDLTDEKGLLCGKLLGELGADVIKVEKPGGDPARSVGPFYHDQPHPEKSLFWFAFNTNKRGITLNLETADGREIFRRLAAKSDFVIESFPPGYLESLGLGYADLERENPKLILVSITPFGQTGPYRDYKAPDIVAWAMSGSMYAFGDADRPPVRISHHSHAYMHASAEAATGAAIALYHREMTGQCQRVDVSIQKSALRLVEGLTSAWDQRKQLRRRGGRADIKVKMRNLWPCKDGFVKWSFSGSAGAKRFLTPFIKWLDDVGMGDDFLRTFDFETFNIQNTTQEVVDRLQSPVLRFMASHTKAELLTGAVKYRVMLYPVSTVADVMENVQLAARDYWAKLEHPELGAWLTYPGPFARSSEAPPRLTRRAPRIGEHNRPIYQGELGLTPEQLVRLKQANVI